MVWTDRRPVSGRAVVTTFCAIALTVGVFASCGGDGRPESIAVSASPGVWPGTTTTPGQPSARWVERGKTFAVTLWGSGTCPPVPTRVQADPAAGQIIVTISEDYKGACTADLGPYTSVVRLDNDMPAQDPVDLIIRQSQRPDIQLRL